MQPHHGGDAIGQILAEAGAAALYTLCGGHISPILTGAAQHGLKVVDVRDEASAVFAADASARMTGHIGVAAVTAGPGVTNTVTAVKNALMAESPVLILGGATATILKGRGSLQDIDQLALMRPLTKWATRVTTAAAVAPTVQHAIAVATSGVPGPVFVELPVDLLYDAKTVRQWYLREAGVESPKSVAGHAMKLAVEAYLLRTLHQPHIPVGRPSCERTPEPSAAEVNDVVSAIRRAERPVLVVGSQAVVGYAPDDACQLAAAIRQLGMPTFLGGAARGLLGRTDPLLFRHKRSKSLKAADLVVVAGFPFDFRLGYGQKIHRHATVVSLNLNSVALTKNRTPTHALRGHAGATLRRLARIVRARPSEAWLAAVRDREQARDAEIDAQAAVVPDERINPMALFKVIEERMAEDAILVVDGGDFVGTAAYILRARRPLSWLDPGVFGTLGVGGGFATGAAISAPGREIWLIYGDGSSAYSLAEFDTYVRHGLAPIAVIGTDASWGQIAREQVEVLGTPLGTELLRTAYHTVAEGYGGVGLLLTDPADTESVIAEAQAHARAGRPVCINVHLAPSDFRKGSISM